MAKKKIGIDALFQTSVPPAIQPTPSAAGEFREVEVEAIRPAARQPRHYFDDASLDQLVASVRAHGILQPLLVRPGAQAGEYELVAGERRWRAARAAGLDRVPIRVVEFDDRQALTAAITEN